MYAGVQSAYSGYGGGISVGHGGSASYAGPRLGNIIIVTRLLGLRLL